jgi:hypothetical protein
MIPVQYTCRPVVVRVAATVLMCRWTLSNTCPGCVPLLLPVGGGSCRPMSRPAVQPAGARYRSAGQVAVHPLGRLPPWVSGSRSKGRRQRLPRSGTFRVLYEIGAAVGADPGPPLPPAPFGSRGGETGKLRCACCLSMTCNVKPLTNS